MNINKNFIGSRMNKSLDERLVPAGEYLDALNVRISSDEDGEAGSAENSKGNERLTNIGGNTKCIGAYQDSSAETIFWFVTGPTVDMILSYNVKTSTLIKHVVSETVLNFSEEHLVVGINLVDDLLFFTDNNNPPRKINIKRNYPEPTGGVDGISEDDISVIVKPPVESPKISLLKKSNEKNYIENKFVRFAYRYKYKDGEYSALSEFSELAFDPGPFRLDYGSMSMTGMRNSKNTVDVTFNTGSKEVVGVDLCFKTSISNTINIIERFDKEEKGWTNNDDVTITFDNQKIYTALPESELLRLYDNVPKKAKTQTVMGNRIMYGNYVDGYDIDTNIDYSLELISDQVGLVNIPDTAEDGTTYTIDTSKTVTNSTLVLDLDGLEIVKGGSINIDFNIQHDSFGGDASYVDGNETQNSYQEYFEFIFPRDYDDAEDLATDQDFIDAIQSSLAFANSSDGYSLTDLFYSQVVANTGWTADGGGITSATGDFAISHSGTQIKIQVPAVRYEDDSAPGTYAYEYFAMSSTTASLNKISNAGSLHSNMDYEVGIVYMDEYNRASTALVSSNNTMFVPPIDSINRNKLRATIKSTAPSWAKRYRMVLKPSKGEYQTIYSHQYYYDKTESVWWVKLDGDNRTKCKVGDTLIVKIDSGGALAKEVKTKVLDIQTQTKGFISEEDNVPPNGGVYMKIRPVGYGVSKPEDGEIDYGNKHAVNKDVLYPAYKVIEGTPNTYEEYTIPAGSEVTFFFDAIRRGKPGKAGSRSYRFDGTFTATRDYDNLYDFIVSENVNFEDPTNDPVAESNDDTKPTGEWNASIGDENDFYALGTQANDQNPEDGHNNIYIDNPDVEQGVIKFRYYRHSSSGKAWLGVEAGGRRASGNNYRMNLHVQVFSAGGLLVFETDPQPNEFELYYEGSDSFEITPDGYHKGNITDQSSSADAVVDINIFNCFSFGNGVESFRIEDGFATPSFKIGERVTSVSEQDFKESHRYADITYSGIYNEESNINRLNEFNLGLVNFKTLEKSFGPIEKMHARQNDILVLQEDKISYLLVGKNLLSDAGAGGAILNTPEVLGNQVARPEEFGISNNPESFAYYGKDVFFTDAKRGAVINIKGGVSTSDQINVISDLGMRSWFRDNFLGNVNKIHLGSYDPYAREYVLSMTNDSFQDEIDTINCGMTITSSKELTYDVELTSVVGNTNVSYDVSSGSIAVSVVYNGSTVINQSGLTGSGTLTFNKNSHSVNKATITITPTNATYSITPECTGVQSLTVIRIVKNTDRLSEESVHHEYLWSESGYTSPIVIDDILFEDGPVSFYRSSTGDESFGSIPAEGSEVTIRYRKLPGDTADWGNGKFKYLVSDTLYEEADIDTLYPLLSEATPIENPDTDVYEATFTYNNPSDHQYLYLVWDYICVQLSDDSLSEVPNGGSKTITVLANDIASLPYTVTIGTQGTYGTAVVNANNTITYTHDGSSNLSDSFTYIVDGGGTCTEEATVTVSILEAGITTNVPAQFVRSEVTLEDGDGYAIWFTDNYTSLDSELSENLRSTENQIDYLVGFEAPTSGNDTITNDVCETEQIGSFTNVKASGSLTSGTFYVIVQTENTYDPSIGSWAQSRYDIQYRPSSSDAWSTANDISGSTTADGGATYEYDSDSDGLVFDGISDFPSNDGGEGIAVKKQSGNSNANSKGGKVFAFDSAGEYRITIGNIETDFGFFGPDGPDCATTDIPPQWTDATTTLNINDFYDPPTSINPDGDEVYEYQIATSSDCSTTFTDSGTSYYAREPFAKYVTQLYTDVALTTKASFTAETKRFRRLNQRGGATAYNPEFCKDGAYTASFNATGFNSTGIALPCTNT